MAGTTSFLLAITLLALLHHTIAQCTYGERGSLMATCVGFTNSSNFRSTRYRFDNLDETVRCANCSLGVLESNSFDLAGNIIKTLDLTNAKITKMRESSFVGLVFLEHLLLSTNKIEAVMPSTFRGIRKLLELQLDNNTINMLVKDGFKELINLQTLNLRNNNIRHVDVGAFNGLGNLTWLDLSYNLIKELNGALTPLLSVTTINMEHNNMLQVNVNDFKNATTVEILNLAKNGIKQIVNGAFLDCEQLRDLDLSWNSLQGLNNGMFKYLRKLLALDLSSNLIGNLPTDCFVGLHDLHTLRLSSNRISRFLTGTFSGLPQLRALNLSSNAIRSVEKSGVFPLHNLHILDVSHNNITDLDYKLLVYYIPRLSSLHVQSNKLPCYLLGELLTFFGNDSIELNMDPYEAKHCHLENPALSKSNVSVQVAESLAKELYDERTRSSHNAAMYTLFTILLVLIGLLFFVQYRTIKIINNGGALVGGGRRSVSHAQLVERDSGGY